MSDALQSRHALATFLASPATKTTMDAPLAIEILPDQHFVNIRGPADNAQFMQAVARASGTDLPLTANTVSAGDRTIYWLGPDEWLLRSDQEHSNPCADLDKRLEGLRASAVDISDGYVMMCVRGAAARELLAKGCTLDLRAKSFTHGQCAQSAIARCSVLISAGGQDDLLEVIVRRTFAEYLAMWLRHSAAEFGVQFLLPGGS